MGWIEISTPLGSVIMRNILLGFSWNDLAGYILIVLIVTGAFGWLVDSLYKLARSSIDPHYCIRCGKETDD
jgi:hypothetical protein